MQAAHPTALVTAYLDDTYTMDEPLEAYACMLTHRGEDHREREAGVASNVGTQEVYSPSGELDLLPGTLRGSPHAPPEPEKGYAGGAGCHASVCLLALIWARTTRARRRLSDGW